MQFDVRATTLAVAIGTAITWILCSVLMALAPGVSMNIMADMVHMDASRLAWSMGWIGFVAGLVGWTLTNAFLAWACANLYNRLTRRSPA